jgi:hypothetical protein
MIGRGGFLWNETEVQIMRLRGVLILLAVVLLVVPLVACGEDKGATETTAATGSPAAERTVAVASPDLMKVIAAGAKKDAVVRPLTGWVVSSANAANVYFVVMEFSSSTENHVGLWATNDPKGAGTFWAINDVAKDSTTFADGSKADPKITADDAGAKDALAKFNVK